MFKNLDSSRSSTGTIGELKPISFIDLEKMKTSHGDLYWKKSDGKLVKLLHCGDYLDFSKLEKFQKITEHLFINEVCSEDFIAEAKDLLSKLLVSTNERERLSYRDSLLKHILPTYWNGDLDGSLLSLVIIFKDIFYRISPKFEEEMDQHALSTLRRASLFSSLVTLLALSVGYTHGSFLTDIYNISFFNDYSYAKNSYKVDDLDHISESLTAYEKSEYYQLSNKHLSRLIKFHHEEFEGNGKGIGLNFNELSELEKISIFIERTLPYSEFEFSSNDGVEFLKGIFKENKEDDSFVKSFKESIRDIFLDVIDQEQIAS